MGSSVPLALESGNQMEGGQREEHAGDADDGLANRPSLEGLSDGETEAVLDDQKPASLRWLKKSEPQPTAQIINAS